MTIKGHSFTVIGIALISILLGLMINALFIYWCWNWLAPQFNLPDITYAHAIIIRLLMRAATHQPNAVKS